MINESYVSYLIYGTILIITKVSAASTVMEPDSGTPR